MSFWNFDEASGNALDSVDSNDGTLGSAVVRVPGLVGSGALDFNRTANASVGVGPGSGGNFAVSSITVETLFKLPSDWAAPALPSEDIFVKNAWPGHILLAIQGPDPWHSLQIGWGLGGNPGSTDYEELGMLIDGVGTNPSVEDLVDGNFHHLVATYDQASGLKAIYLDGTMRASKNYAPGTVIYMGDTTTPTFIGAAGASAELFYGILDEVAFYNHALGGSDVLAHYQLAQAGQSYIPEPSMVTMLLVCGLAGLSACIWRKRV